MRKIITLLSVVLTAGTLSAQNINMGSGNASACTGNFYDSGGAGGNYGNSQNSTITICPSTPGSRVQINMTTFNVEANRDYLYIYDGNSISAPSLGVYTGTTGLGNITASPSNASGCLTFRFTSDAANTAAGWAGSISCTTPCQNIVANLVSTAPVAGAGGIIRVCQGQPITFNGSGTFSVSGTGATYNWDFDDGTTGTGTSVTHTYNTPGIYMVDLVVRDPSNCSSHNAINQMVYVSTTPVFRSGSAVLPTTICLGQQATLPMNPVPRPAQYNCTPPVSGQTFLPDGTGVSYQTSIFVDCYGSGTTLTNANQLDRVCMNIEHSYLGDLDIALICPNGQSVTLKPYPGGGGTYLGGANDDATTNPGVGADYCFSMSSAWPTMLGANNATYWVIAGSNPANNSMRPGTYLPDQSFNNLVGCPLNGTWSIRITDNMGYDNGYIFSWGLTFANSVLPSTYSFTPTLTSQGFQPNPTIVSSTPTSAVVQPTTVGSNCYVYSVTDNFGCTYDTTMCINVIAGPYAGVDNTLSICSNAAATNLYSLLGSGVSNTGTWTGPTALGGGYLGTLNPATAASGTYTYTVPGNSQCPPDNATVTVTIRPTPTVNAVSNQNVCNGAPTAAVNFAGSVPGTVYDWTSSNPAIGLAASGSGNIASFTATNTGTAPINSTITVTPTANGCTGTPTTFVITVNPTPTLNAVGNQTLCAGSPTAAISFGGAVIGTTFAWTNNTTSIGLGASGNGNIGSFTATNAGTAPVTATVTVTPSAFGCPGTPGNFTITVNPRPTVNAVGNQTLCNGAATAAVNFAGPVAGTTYAWTNSATSIGLAASGNGNIGSFTATNTGTTPVTATITVTPTANGCTGTPITYTYTVNPTPTVNAVGNQTLCAGAATAAVNFGGTVTGTTYAWANNTTSIGLAATGNGNIGSFTATNAGSAPVTATVTVTPSANGCSGTPGNFTITVNPRPAVNAVGNQTLCNGAATAAVNFAGPVAGTTYAWTNSATSIGLAASGNGNIGSFTATNTGTTPVTATITVTPTANGCTGTPITYTYTVNPTPTVNAVGNQTLCTGATTAAVNFGGTVAGTAYAWTNSDPTIGLAASGNGNIAAFTATNTGTAPVTATVTVTPSANGCPGTPRTFTITVNPRPTVTAVMDQKLCAGSTTTAVNFGGSVTGTTYAWTNTATSIGLAASGNGNIAPFTATNAGSTTVTATITVTPSANGCAGTPTTFTITVDPTPTVNAVANQTLCNGAATTAITFAGPVTGTTYAWTNNTTSTGLAASGNGNIGSFTATNTGIAPVTSTVTVTPTANGCPGTPGTFTITVNPTPTVNAVGNQTLCAGAAATAINFGGAVTGTTYAWTNNTTSIGLGASGNGNIASFTTTNAGTAPVTATVTVTPTANGCPGTPGTFTITVNPRPTVNAVTNQTLCNGASTTAVTFGSPVAGTTYAWTNNTTSIGLAASGNGNIAAFTATNTGTAPVTATVTVTPTANGCPGTPITYTYTVNPTPTVNAVTNQTLCNGATTTAVTFAGPVAGTTYAWTNSTTSIGLGASGNGNIGAFTATNTGTAPVTATITVTPTANGCPGTPITYAYTVNPTPTVNAVANQTLCNGAATTGINFGSPVTGTTYAWTNTTTSIGLAATGNGNIGSFTATNTGTAPVTATVTVTPTANGCPGTPATFTITVNPTPTVNAVTNQTLCNGATTTAVNFGGTVAGTTYVWTNDNPTIGLAATGNGNIGTFTATNTGTAPVTATVTVTPSANGCPGAPRTFTITVNPTPTINNVPDQILCNGATTTAVNFGGAVTGTTYAWTNNTTSIGLAGTGNGNIAAFTATNTGTAPITATVTATPGANGCTGTPETFTITVNPTPTVNNIANQTLCNGANTTAVTFAGPVAGTTFAWTNNTTSIGLGGSGNGNIASFAATNTGTAPVTATVTITPTANGCTGTPNTFTITVNPTATVDNVPDQTLCNGTSTTAINFTNPVAGTTYAWTNNMTSIGLAGTGNGNIASFTATNTNTAPVTATVTVTPTANGCVGTPETFTITVNPTPTVNNIASQTLCNGAATTAVTFAGPVAGTTYAWANNTTSIGLAGTGNGNIASFTATNTGTAPVTATVTVTPTANGCVGTPNTFTVTVNPTPDVAPVADQTLCNGAATTAVNFTGAVTGTTYAWTNDDPTIGLGANGNGNIAAFTATNTGTAPVTATITVTPTANACPGASETFTITVNPTATVDNVPNQTLCNGATTTAVSFTNPVAGTTYAWTNNTTSIGLAGTGNGNIGAFTATNTGAAPVTATITVTPTANGCTGTPNTFTITVNPTATVDNVPNQTLCDGATTTAVTFTNPVAGTTYAWTNNTTSIGLAGSGNGNIGAFTATNTGTAPVTATVTVTPTANGCVGTPNTFTITVNPTATVDNVPNQTLCNGATTTPVTFTNSVAGTTYAWTNSDPTIGLAANGNGNIAAFTATNTGAAPVTATITVTPSATGCVGVPNTFTITVNPTATVDNVPNQTLCNGTTTAAVPFTNPVAGTTYAWTNNTTSIGLAGSGNGNIAAFTATNTGTAPVTATITVTPTANGCTGTPNTFTITVNPTATVDNVPNQTLCNGATTAAVTFANPVAGTTYAWTNSDPTIGLAANGNGNIATFTVTNTGTAPVTATVTVTPTANACVGTPNTFTITVNPTATVDNVASQTLCNGAATTAVNFTNPVAGTTYAWTNSDPSIGLAANGNGNIASFNATNTGSAPVTATVTVTPTANGCTGTPNTFTVTVNPTATVDNVANQTLCNGVATTAVNFTNPVAGTTYAWTNSDPTIGLAANGNGNIASFNATNTGSAPVTATITVTPTANACVGTPNTFTVTVNPTATVDNVPNQILCNGATTTAVTFTNPVAGTTYAWVNNTTSIGLAASGNGNIASFTATNTGTAPVTATVTVTPTANGCVGTPNTFTVTVNPTPNVNPVTSQTLCNGATTTAVNFGGAVAGTTYAWTNDDPSIGLAANGNGNIAAFTATNTGTAPVTGTIVVTPSANGCTGPAGRFTITVNPTATVDNVANQTLCNGVATTAVNFTNPVSGTTYAWTNSDPTIGLAANGSGNIASFSATNTGSAPVTATITVTPTANACVGTPNTFTITVNPTATVDNVANQTLCNGVATIAVNFTNPVAGTTYAWTNSDPTIGLAANGTGNIASFNATNTGNAPVTSTITVTPTANACVGIPNIFTVTVNPTATVNAVANQTLCNGATTTAVTFANPVAGTTYAWTNNDPSIGLAANGTGNIAAFTATNTGSAPVTATITVTPTANACVGTPNTFTITVNPTATVDNVANQTLCNGVSTTAVNFTNPVAGTTYAWTNSDPTIGLAANGNGNIASFNATNTGSAPVTATITVTPTANGCVGTPNTFTVTVNPTATVDNVPNQTLCNGVATTAVTFTNPVAGTTYAWTNSAPTIGLAANGNGNIASFNATNTGSAPVTATITVTPTANACVGTPNTFTVTVNPTATVDNVANQTLCNGVATTAVNFTNPVAGTAYAWTNSDPTIGLAANGTGNIASFNATNTGSAPVTATITVTPTANACVGTPNTFTVTVNPTSTVDVVANQMLCNGAATTAVTFTNPVAGTTYAWTNSDPTIGLAANGNGNIASFNATNTGSAPVTATITVTPTANACGGTPRTFTITVNPTATVDAVANQTLCNGVATTAVTFTNPVAGTTYAWTNSDPTIGLAANGNGNIASFTATNTGSAPVTATVTVTPTANACVGTPNTFTVTVNPTATVDNVANQTLCNGVATTAVNFTNPVAGTTYAWTNSDPTIGLAANGNGNIASFTATNTGSAPVTATITVTPTANACVGTPRSFTVTVNPTATVDAVANQTLCNGVATTAVNFTNPVAGTTYAWTNSDPTIGLAANGNGNIASFTATNMGSAPVTATITVTPTANACVGTAGTFTITVNPTATVDNIPNQTLCNGAASTAVTLTNPVAGTTYAWVNDNTSIGLAAGGNGDIVSFTATNTGTAPVTATIKVTPTANACVGTSRTFTITVNPTATVNAVANQTLCNGAPTTAVTFANPVAGTTYAWTNDNPSIGLAASGTGNIASFSVTNTGAAPVTATVTVTPTANACTGTPNAFTITVNPTATVDAVVGQVLCSGDNVNAFTFTGPVTGTTYTWTNDNTGIGLASGGSGNIASFIVTNPGSTTITSTITVTPTANGCVGTPRTFVLTVNPIFAGTETVSICQGDQYMFGGQPYTSTGSYPVVFQSFRGCDSTVTLNLTVHPTYQQVLNPVICRGSAYRFNGVDYTQTGVYPVMLTTVHGCDSAFTINLTVQGPTAAFNANPPVGCVPLTVSFSNLSGPGVTSAWDFGNGSTGTGNTPVITYTNPGTYSVTLTVTDALGCKDVRHANGLIVVNQRPKAGMVVSPRELWMDEPYIQVSDASAGANAWLYNISDGMSTTESRFAHSFMDTGQFLIEQVVYNGQGCADTAYETVTVKAVATIYVPNAFSPNTDFQNPLFKAYGNSVSEFEMMIFNRWGEMLFKTKHMDEGWDGTYGGKQCPVDVYVYKINYRDHRKQSKTLSGSITLVR